MDFEKQTLHDYFVAMCHEFEKDYYLDWLGVSVDFFFPAQNVGVNYSNGGKDSIAEAYAKPRTAKQIRKRGVKLHTLTVADVCERAILEKIPSICDPIKTHDNKGSMKDIMRRFIQRLMAEITEEQPDFGAWTSQEEGTAQVDYDPNEEPGNSELETERQTATINSGKTENAKSTELNQIEIEEAHP